MRHVRVQEVVDERLAGAQAERLRRRHHAELLRQLDGLVVADVSHRVRRLVEVRAAQHLADKFHPEHRELLLEPRRPLATR